MRITIARALLLAAVSATAGCASQPLGVGGTGIAATLVDAIVGVPVLTVVEDAARTAAADDGQGAAELTDAYDEFLRSQGSLDRPDADAMSPIVINRR